jgi:hypothetical protein
MFNNFFFRISCRYAIVWENVVEPDTPQMRKWRMRIEYWINKASNTPSEYVNLSVFPLKKCLQNRDSLLRYTYTAFHVIPTLSFTLYVHCLSRYTYTVFHVIRTLSFTLYVHCLSRYTYTVFHVIRTLSFTLNLHCLSRYTYTVFHVTPTLSFTLYVHSLSRYTYTVFHVSFVTHLFHAFIRQIP